MLKDRIQEVFEFTKSESPYRKANKGWINQDIFLDLSSSSDTVKQTNEAAKVTVFWSPINSLLSKIFLIIIFCSILVFCSVSFAKGRFDIDLFNNPGTSDIVKVDEKKDLNISVIDDVESIDETILENIDTKSLEEIKSLDNNLMKEDKKLINKKIEKQEGLIKKSESKIDSKISQNKKQKSNFI